MEIKLLVMFSLYTTSFYLALPSRMPFLSYIISKDYFFAPYNRYTGYTQIYLYNELTLPLPLVTLILQEK